LRKIPRRIRHLALLRPPAEGTVIETLVSRIFRHRFTVMFGMIALNNEKKHSQTTGFMRKSANFI